MKMRLRSKPTTTSQWRSRLTLTSIKLVALAAVSSVAAPGAAFSTTASVTSDNFYGIYTGDAVSATANHGSDGAWSTVETYTFNMNAGDYLYVAVWSDDSSWQGFLGQFDNHNGRFYSSDPAWQVTATGIDKDSMADLPTLFEMTTEIGRANAGTNASLGWVTPTLGWTNVTGSQYGGSNNPWGQRAVIDKAAMWSWYNTGLDARPTAPFAGYNHAEFLIYRIPGDAVPEPATMVALAMGIGGLVARRRRRRQA